MKRIWDVVVGLFMVVVGLFVTFIFAGLLGIAFSPLVPPAWEESRWLSPVAIALLVLFVQAAAFFDFYRRRKINTVYGSAGRIHLVPRGWHRARYGSEQAGEVAPAQAGIARARVRALPSLLAGVVFVVAGVAGILIGGASHGQGMLVLACLGLILLVVSPILFAHALLARLGVLRRVESLAAGEDATEMT